MSRRGVPGTAAPFRRNSGLSEWSALELLKKELGSGTRRADVELGIGDDCAILAPQKTRSVWTLDACLEDQHFRWDWLSPADVAHKALHAAVSDVAAMGARPVAALSHLTLSPSFDRRKLAAFARGQARASQSAECPVIGGNLSRGDSFGVVTSVLGVMKNSRVQPLRRAGARPGEQLWLVGDLGLSRLGLALLESGYSGRGPALVRRAAQRCLLAFRRPMAQVSAGPELVGRATSCLDVSDGLAGDAAHLAEASGVRVVVERAQLLEAAAPELLLVATALGLDPLTVLSQGGEDYALLATGPARKRPPFARVIGRIEHGQGVVLAHGTTAHALRGGFEHGER